MLITFQDICIDTRVKVEQSHLVYLNGLLTYSDHLLFRKALNSS